jgi:hypothetical protein
MILLRGGHEQFAIRKNEGSKKKGNAYGIAVGGLASCYRKRLL